MFLLDTNVISDPVGRQPTLAVAQWIRSQSSDDLYLSSLTVAEIEFGVARLDASRNRDRLVQWRDEILESFGGRILSIDLDVAIAWGRVRAEADRQQRTIPVLDAFLAATAEVHGLTVVTRNVRHFKGWGGPILNPWGD